MKILLLHGITALWLCFAASGATPFAFLTSSNAWKYNDESMDLGTAWIATDYNDSAWSNGLPAFGFAGPGNTNELLPQPNFIRTLLRARTPTNSTRSILTFYFRTHFTYTNDPGDVILTASNLIDDGAVFYLNGQELKRVAMSNGPVTFSSLATRNDDIGTSRTPTVNTHGYDTFSVPATLLQGDNVVAVEVHQATISSADMVFQMELWAEAAGAPAFGTQPVDAAIVAGTNVTMSVSLASGLDANIQWFHNSIPLPARTNSILVLTNAVVEQTGRYYATASNSHGMVTSSVAGLSVVGGEANLRLLEFTNVWRFNQSGSDLGTAWSAPAYDDTSWPVGLGVFFHCLGCSFPESTNQFLSLTNNSGSVIITYYFRAHMTLPSSVSNIVLVSSHLLDDGAVFYLNGNEAGRSRLIGPVTAALSAAPSPRNGLLYETMVLASTNLVPGDNVLAVEVHQDYPFSNDDVAFGMSLRAFGAFNQPVVILNPPLAQTVNEGTSASLFANVLGAQPLFFQWLRDGFPLPDETNMTLRIDAAHPAIAGNYTFIVTNALNTVTSTVATLSVIADTTSPTVVAAYGTNGFSGLVVLFSEPVAPQSATNIMSYVLSPAVDIFTVEMIAPNAVLLTTSGLDPEFDYTLLVSDVSDAADNPNFIAPNTATHVQPNPRPVPPQTVVTWYPSRVFLETTNIVSVGAGTSHYVALRRDGVVLAWGAGSAGIGGYTNVASIDAGYFHNLAALSNGTVIAWGFNDSGSTVVPSGISNVVAVAAGGGHSVILRRDGTVRAWGYNGAGQTNVPTGLTSVVGISAGVDHTLAVRANGSVVAWGHGVPDFGQSNVPLDLTNAIAVSAGSFFSVALRSDNTVTAWGYNGAGCTDVPPGLSNVIAIAAGCSHVLALKSDGSVVTWGVATTPLGLTNATAIGAGCSSIAVCDFPPVIETNPTNATGYTGTSLSFSVVAKGTQPFTYQWFKDGITILNGTNSILNLVDLQFTDAAMYSVTVRNSLGDTTSTNAALTVIEGPPVLLQSPASRNSFLHQNVSLSVGIGGSEPMFYQWHHNGADIAGQTGPQLVLSNVSFAVQGNYSVTVTNRFGMVLTSNAELTVANIAVWGDATFGQPNVPAPLTNAAAIACGGEFMLAMDESGTLFSWGRNNAGQSTFPPGLGDIVSFSARNDDSFAVRRSGELVPSGGTSVTALTNYPADLTNVVAVATGLFFALALKNDGTLIGWGSLPGSVSISNVIQVKANRVGLALRNDGTVVGIGTGSFNQGVIPTDLTNVIAVECGTSHSIALKRDGTVVAWGANSSGQTNVPAGLTNVMAIAAGSSHSMALKRDHTVVVWGMGPTNVPVELTNVIAISSGRLFCAALIDDQFSAYESGNTLSDSRLSEGLFTTSTPTLRNHTYVVEGTDSIGNQAWNWHGLVAGVGATTNISLGAPTANQRIFRLRRQQL